MPAKTSRLYRNRIIDQYLTYKPFFLEEGKKEKHHLPEHITFTLHDRRTSGETAEGAEVSSELRGQRSKLKLRLQCNYDVSEKKAWIKRCEPLWNELQRLGYQEHSQYFPPRQVFTIFEYLGEPGA